MNLHLLAPEIQEAILDLAPVTNGCDPVSERANHLYSTCETNSKNPELVE